MNDPLQEILKINARQNLFPQNSRYHGTETATMEDGDGRKIVYLCRRFVPAPERFVTVQEHTVVQGDRLDLLAARYIGDPEQFWRICDANRAIDPVMLTSTPGKKLRITLPEGITGVNYG